MIDLTVKTLDAQNHNFFLDDDQITVRGFKEYIAESVAVPADSQRLIYCGRVLQDEKKLNDYDVNGKVIHLVQRAPPQSGQRGNDSGQTQGQGQEGGQNQRAHYRLAHAQMHGNAMYFGAMSVPAEVVEGHGLPAPQLSNRLSYRRLNVARDMLERTNEIIDHLDDPTRASPSTSESNQSEPQQIPVQDLESEHEEVFSNSEGRTNGGTRLAEAAAAAIAAVLSVTGANNVTVLRGSTNVSVPRTLNATRETSSDATNQTEVEQQQQQSTPLQQQQQSTPLQQQQQSTPLQQQQQSTPLQQQQQSTPLQQQQQQSTPPQQQQQSTPPQQQQQEPQAEQQETTSNAEGQANRRRLPFLRTPRPQEMAVLLDRLVCTQNRLRPYLNRYCLLLYTDPSLLPGTGPESVEENQRIVDGVSESLHYLSHACHALSDIIVDMRQRPPRNLRCRPILVHHSAILQAGIPIQLEATFSLPDRNGNNNNVNGETNDTANSQPSSDSAESSDTTEGSAQSTSQQESENVTQPQPDEPQQPEQTQSPFGTVFNLPNNVEVLMEVSQESNIEPTAGTDQNQSTTNNSNNNSNTGRQGAGAAIFPFPTPPPPDFIRNLMHVVAGHMVQQGIATTSTTTRSPPPTYTPPVDSTAPNVGQSTQARITMATHPTTATHTRSTSRPHVFHQHTHPMGIGMSMGQGGDFDPFLPCNSHHVRRTPSDAPNPATTTSQTVRPNPPPTSESQAQSQPATSNANSAQTSASAPPTTSQGNPFARFLRRVAGEHEIIDETPLLRHTINIMQMLDGENTQTEQTAEGNANADGQSPTLAELLEPRFPTDYDTALRQFDEHTLLSTACMIVANNLTLEGLARLRSGQLEPIIELRGFLNAYFQIRYPSVSCSEETQSRVTERLISQIKPFLQRLLESDDIAITDSRIDLCGTIQALLFTHGRDIMRVLYYSALDNESFGRRVFSAITNLGRQLCTVIRHSVRGGQAGLEAIILRFMDELLDGVPYESRERLLSSFMTHFRSLSTHLVQPPEAEILPLLKYVDTSTSETPPPSAKNESPQQPEDELMETETVELKPNNEASMVDDNEAIPEIFPGYGAMPSDWVPIIARDGVRQRRQLQMQGVANGGIATFSDAYLGGLPTKRRKLIEQQKPRLLVSPTPNHTAITASMERLVRDSVGRTGVEEVEGAAVAVAADPGVRRAFGQAIRDCLNPRRYGTPDFPDPLRFPNATRYFADQERPSK